MKRNGSIWAEKLRAGLSKYKYVLLVILAGIVLLLLPSRSGGTPQAQAGQGETQCFSLEGMERKLEHALSQVAGAGRVQVVLAIKCGPKQVLAQDSRLAEQERTVNTVILAKGGGTEEAVRLQELSPQFQGALVVCAGGNDPAVRLAMTTAIAALTGLGSNQISICKGK